MSGSNNESLQLPRLPAAFWTLGEQISQSWQGLLQILDQEWKALENVDLAALWQISEAKNRQAEKIEALEKRLNAAVDSILARCGSTPGAERWGRILTMLQHDDVGRLQSWMARVRDMKCEVREINSRHTRWLAGQLRLIDQLTGILTGKSQEKSPVYSPKGRPCKPGCLVYQGTEVA